MNEKTLEHNKKKIKENKKSTLNKTTKMNEEKNNENLTMKLQTKKKKQYQKDMKDINEEKYKWHQTIYEKKNNRKEEKILQQKIITTTTKDKQVTILKQDIENENKTNSPIVLNPNFTVDNRDRGHTMDIKEVKTFRFIYQNINSLRPANQEKWKSTIVRMKQLQGDIIGFSETSVNWNKTSLRQKYQNTINKLFKNTSLIESKMEDEYNNDYLPGRTIHITLNKWTSYIKETIIDPSKFGRWSGATYRLSPINNLHIISAYRPCKRVKSYVLYIRYWETLF